MAIVIKDDKVEIFEISDGELKLIKAGSSPQTTEEANQKNLLELYKMEYERCALRYDDLYKAAWTNFSYIALIAGAILTFGSDSFMTELSIFVATLPLLFWWIATFEPLNRYGGQVEARAACIERMINELVGIVAPEKLCEEQKKQYECEKGLRHFQDFKKRQFDDINWVKLFVVAIFWSALLLIAIYGFDLSKLKMGFVLIALILLLIWLVIQYKAKPHRLWYLLRVRFVVRVVAGILLIVAAASAHEAYKKHQLNEPFIKSSKSDSKLPERLNIKIEK